MSIAAAYTMWSKSYNIDRNITRDLDKEITPKVLAGMSFSSVVEFGCGTGKNTLFYSSIAEKVIALDFSEGMISVAKNSINAENVKFELANITNLWPISNQSQSLVTCNLILQHIADLGFVFAEARRTLIESGYVFISELHPIKKYQGSMARFEQRNESVCIPAFDHQISHFIKSAGQNGFKLVDLSEWWHADDLGRPPRLVTFLFKKVESL